MITSRLCLRLVGVVVDPHAEVAGDLDAEPGLLEHLALDRLDRMLARSQKPPGEPHSPSTGVRAACEEHPLAVDDDRVRARLRVQPVARPARAARDGRRLREVPHRTRSRSARERPRGHATSCSGAEDEDDVRAVELAQAHAVERRDLLHAEVACEPSSLADEAGPVHDDAAREVAARRVPDAADPVAALLDACRGDRGGALAAVPVEDEDADLRPRQLRGDLRRRRGSVPSSLRGRRRLERAL